jgi:transposase
MWPIRTTDQKEESMNMISQNQIIGIDVSRDWLDIHCLPDGHRLRIANTAGGHEQLAEIAHDRRALVCFEATGAQEWWLWATLDAAGIATRQLPPAQIKAFAMSRGTRAKTDQIDAELIARFMVFRPDAGRSLPAQKLRHLRALTGKRGQLVEMRKRLLVQIKARLKQGLDEPLEDMDDALRIFLTAQIAELESQIERLIAADKTLAETARIIRSVPGIGPVASTMLIAEMPELGQISGEQAAALTGLAPIAHDSGALRGRRAIGGGRRLLRHVLFQAALVASYHNPVLRPFADRLRAAGKPHKLVVTAVARKLVTIANALCKSRQNWAPPAT